MGFLLAALVAATPLVDAVRNGDVEGVRASLKSGADVNQPEGDGATALHWAVHRDSLELVKLLLGAGALANVANDLGITPLHLAAANGNVATLRLLLDKRANPNAAAASGVTPLMEASRGGSVDAVRLLIAHGADVNAHELARGQTALMWAVSRQHPDIVKALIENKADVTARTGSRPVQVMLDRGPRRAVKTSAQDARQIQAGGSTALIFAAQTGSVESARLLLAAGANANDTAGDGKSALVMAAFSGHTDVATLLLAAGADPNAAAAGYTALHAAALRGDVTLVKSLLDKGANPNATQTKGSPVRRFGSQWALSSPFNGGTPLIVAAAYLEIAVMRALIQGGARADAALPNGMTALLIAAGAPIEKEARPSDLTKWNIVDSDAPEIPRPAEDVISAVRLLLDAGADVTRVSETGDTALHGAAVSNQPAVIELLVEHGAQVNAKNKNGQTPLTLTLPRKSERGPGFAGYPEAEATLRKLGATQ
ncbi:MAG TPA: ankyrin repeat domain-containing protein [Vicinamibacterales bacterium]|nr:ankyrin repeat domain-containing protein [Vicinamibacterales bacterium]